MKRMAYGWLGAVGVASLMSTSVLAEDFVVGAPVAKTGWLAPYDSPVLDGFVLAMEELNAGGGIAGKFTISLVTKDNRSDNAQNAIITQELADEDVDFMIVTCDSSMVHATADIIVESETPAISSCSSSPTLPLTGDGYIFANAPADNMQGTVQAVYAREQGYDNAFLLISPDIEYTLMPNYFGTVFENLGGTVVGTGTYALSQPDFSAEVSKINALDPQPDVIVTSAFEPDFPAFIRQLRASGSEIPVIAGDGIDSPTTFALGETVEGVVFTTAGYAEPGSELEAFAKKFEAHYGRPSETIMDALGYDLAQVLASAIEKAGTIEGPAVRAALSELETVSGVTGDITFAGTNGTPQRPVVLLRITGGEREFVSRSIPDAALVPAPQF